MQPAKHPRSLFQLGIICPDIKQAVREIACASGRALGDELQFDILAADHDLGGHEPFPGIAVGAWLECGRARVM